MMIGAAMWNAQQTGLDKMQAVREKLADLVCYREGINAHLTASIALAAEEPGRPADAEPVDALCRPRLRLLEPAADDAYRARIVRRADLRHARRGRVRGAETGPWLEKFYSLNDNWQADDRRKLLAFARDLLNSDYAGHRLTFQFAQAPHFNHLAAVYNFDFSGPLDFVKQAAGLSDRVLDREGVDTVPTHTRIRKFNTKDAYPEQKLDNDVCMAVRAGNTVYLRGQTAMDLDRQDRRHRRRRGADRERDGQRRVAARRGGAKLDDICKSPSTSPTRAYREPVYRVVGKWLNGVFPRSPASSSWRWRARSGSSRST